MSNLKPDERNLRYGPVSRVRTLTGRARTPWLNSAKRERSWPWWWATRLAFLSLMLFPVLPSIAADYRDYPDDVRLLLEEYAGASDRGGSLIPSVYAFRSSQAERVLIDFDRGLIVVSAPTISLLLKGIQDVLLTQIDPGVSTQAPPMIWVYKEKAESLSFTARCTTITVRLSILSKRPKPSPFTSLMPR